MPLVLEYERPYFYPKQLRAAFCPERYSICEASTKAGKTHVMICWLFERALFHPEHTWHWWVAPTLGQARTLGFERMLKALKRSGLILNEHYRVNRSLMEIHLHGAGSMAFRTAEEPDSLYGEDVYSLVTDEASRCKVEAFHAMRSTLTFTRGQWRLIGNVKGRKNEMYRMARLAQSGEPDYHYEKITAYDAVAAGVYPMEELEDAKRMLPEAAFKELYLAEPGEDGGNPFGYSHIEACQQPEWFKPVYPNSGPGGRPSIYPYGCECVGIDLAKSKDYTTLIALDDAGNSIFIEKTRQDWLSTIDLLAAHLKGLNPSGAVLVDSTGVGDPVLENLQAAVPMYDVRGVKFSSQTKQQMMEGLAVALQQRELSYPANHDLVDELMAYEYVYLPSGVVRYSAPEGQHDDLVIALALANRARNEEVASWDW